MLMLRQMCQGENTTSSVAVACESTMLVKQGSTQLVEMGFDSVLAFHSKFVYGWVLCFCLCWRTCNGMPTCRSVSQNCPVAC